MKLLCFRRKNSSIDGCFGVIFLAQEESLRLCQILFSCRESGQMLQLFYYCRDPLVHIPLFWVVNFNSVWFVLVLQVRLKGTHTPKSLKQCIV